MQEITHLNWVLDEMVMKQQKYLCPRSNKYPEDEDHFIVKIIPPSCRIVLHKRLGCPFQKKAKKLPETVWLFAEVSYKGTL